MFSSYVWNYPIIDGIAKLAKADGKVTVLGGPHIGKNEPDFLLTRSYYDYICEPTRPGEVFMEDLINYLFDGKGDIAWLYGTPNGRVHDISKEEYSIYEEHFEYLKKIREYADDNDMEQFVIIETTRGCPYQCVFCEWGGGIGTKVYKKELDIVKRDIDALIKAGYTSAYLTDANFGMFFDRDIEIFKYAWTNGFNLTDISTMKAKDYNRRQALIDAWFDTVGTTDLDSSSIVPTVSIQSISEDAMKIAKRVDLSLEDKLKLSRHINKRCREENLPVPALELILAMPGSTIEDFYDEMEVIWNFQAWGSYRHDYMFLPDSTLSSNEYKEEHKIKTVEVYTDIADEDGIDNINSLYSNRQSYFRTMLSCYSFTEEELKEMWFMNNAANYMLKHWYEQFQDIVSVQQFTKTCYLSIKNIDSFQPLKKEIDDIFNPNTPPKSIRRLGGKFRVETIEDFLKENKTYILSQVMEEVLIAS